MGDAQRLLYDSRRAQDATLAGTPGAEVAMCSLREGRLRASAEDACRAEGLEPAGRRSLLTRTTAFGATALASLPRIEQLVLVPSEHPDAERRAYRPRRRGERVAGVSAVSAVSVRALLGSRAVALGADGPLLRLTVLPGFLLDPSGRGPLSPLRLDATFTREEGLGRAPRPGPERHVSA